MTDKFDAQISYKSPKPMRDLDAYVLSMVLRIASTGKTFAERSIVDGVSVLTVHNLAYVAPVYAYFRRKIRENDVKTREEFNELMPAWNVGVDNWCETHQEEISKVIKELGEYVDIPPGEFPARAGFSCWDAGGK